MCVLVKCVCVEICKVAEGYTLSLPVVINIGKLLLFSGDLGKLTKELMRCDADVICACTDLKRK